MARCACCFPEVRVGGPHAGSLVVAAILIALLVVPTGGGERGFPTIAIAPSTDALASDLASTLTMTGFHVLDAKQTAALLDRLQIPIATDAMTQIHLRRLRSEGVDGYLAVGRAADDPSLAYVEVTGTKNGEWIGGTLLGFSSDPESIAQVLVLQLAPKSKLARQIRREHGEEFPSGGKVMLRRLARLRRNDQDIALRTWLYTDGEPAVPAGSTFFVRQPPDSSAPVLDREISTKVSRLLEAKGHRTSAEEDAGYIVLFWYGTQAVLGKFVHDFTLSVIEGDAFRDRGEHELLWTGKAELTATVINPDRPLERLDELVRAACAYFGESVPESADLPLPAAPPPGGRQG